MVAKAAQLFAKPVFKYLKSGLTKGPGRRPPKTFLHYEYGGKKYQLEDLIKVNRRGEKGRPVSGLVPKTVEAERLAQQPVLSATTGPKARETTPRVKEMSSKLNAMSDDEVKYITLNQAKEKGISANLLAGHRQKRFGPGSY